MLQIKPLIRRPLLITRIPPHRTNINHPIPELHKRAPLHRQLQIRDIMQDELDQLLVLLLADPRDEGLRREFLAQLVGREAVLREAEVEHGCDGDVGAEGAELLLLFGEVGAADEADGAFLAEGGEEGEDFGGYVLGVVLAGACRRGCGGGVIYSAGESEGSVHVEETDCVLDGPVGERD